MTDGFQLSDTSLNGICPYFTMFPLDFPLNILKRRARAGDVVLDPFGGVAQTAIACLETNRRYICVDSETRYIDIAEERIRSWKERNHT